MELFQLKLFASIAKTHNFSKTAEQFFVTQPAVSHQIKRLEENLNILLVKRSSHGIQLTPEGKIFLEYALEILELSDSAESRMQNLSIGRIGHLKIATLPICRNEVAKCMRDFLKQFPTVQIDVEILEGKELIEKALNNEADFYFFTDEMCCASTIRNHLFIKKSRLYLFVSNIDSKEFDFNDWTTLSAHPFVSVYQSDTLLYNQINLVCKKRGLKPKIVGYFNRAESALISVNAGIGKAIFPGDYLEISQAFDIKTYPISGKDAEINYVVGWNSDNFSKASMEFFSILNKYYASSFESK